MSTEASASVSAPATDESGRHFWERRFIDGRPDGAHLAALRRGAGREPGTVPQMWRHYSKLNRQGDLTVELRAEHVALVLFAIHQQSQPTLMHSRGISVGKAVAGLKGSRKFSPEAVNRRFAAAATATSLDEVAYHLRGLVRQMRSLPSPQRIDYTQLYDDLVDWQNPAKIGKIRRRWGFDYFLNQDGNGAGKPATG